MSNHFLAVILNMLIIWIMLDWFSYIASSHAQWNGCPYALWLVGGTESAKEHIGLMLLCATVDRKQLIGNNRMHS